MNNQELDRVQGAILGTSIGDILGMPVEGLKPDTIKKHFGWVKTYRTPKKGIRNPYHRLKRRQWTDDTQLMLAVGESIVEKRCINFKDIAARHIIAFHNRRGWGKSTTNSIQRIIAGKEWWESGEPGGVGNGPPMKIAPIGVIYGLGMIKDFEAISSTLNISRMTHLDPRPSIAAILQVKNIASGIIGGVKGLKESLERSVIESAFLEKSIGKENPSMTMSIHKALGLVQSNKSDEIIRRKIGARPYIIESYPFTCAMTLKYIDNPEECLEKIINQGGDADTNGAMAGAMLGAAHGLSSFPKRWRWRIEERTRILQLASNLFESKRSN